VRDALPEARFLIAGWGKEPEVLALGQMPGVEIRTNVPSMSDVLCEARVAVAPMLSGSGIKNKVLEAWACGRPAVMTSLASNGLSPGFEECSYVEDTPEGLAEAVIEVLSSDETRRKLGEAGRDYVRRHHGWARAADTISGILSGIAGTVTGEVQVGKVSDAAVPVRIDSHTAQTATRLAQDETARLRIAVLISLVPEKWGTMEEWLIALAAGARRRGHTIDVFCREPIHPAVAEAFAQQGSSWVSIEALQDRAIRGVRRLRDYDAIHINMFGIGSSAALMAYAAWPTPIVYVDHFSDRSSREGLRANVRRRILASIARWRIHKVVGVSRFTSRHAAALLGVGPRNAMTIYNGINLERFVWRSPAEWTQGYFTVLAVANLIPAKGIDHLLRAAAVVDSLRVRIVGDGPERENLQRLAAELAIEDRTEFLGLRDDVDRLLHESHAYVHPAVWTEAFGLAIAEAMASGCPVVASLTGAVSELIQDEVSGLLVSPSDEQALADALRRMMDDHPLRRRLSENARRRAEDWFDLSECAEQHVDVCEEVCTGVRSAGPLPKGAGIHG
jgi:glycosyltransferase involved in cell wall biosynthesis